MRCRVLCTTEHPTVCTHVLIPVPRWAALRRGSHNLNKTKEVAQNFKEQGNEYFKSKKYREALGFYTQGVDAKPDDVRLKEALLLNRAACNLELRASLLRSSASLR